MPNPSETYKPCYDGPIAGWVVNTMQRDFWRVERVVGTREDYLQEAYLVFLRIAQRYPDMDTPQHFMALFQRSWTNHVNDLSSRASRRRAEVSASGPGEEGDAGPADFVGALDNDGHLAVLLRQAPSEVRQVCNLFLNAPQELLELALASWRGESRDQRCTAGGSKKVNQLLGLPEERDVLQEVRDYFTP